MNDADDLRQRLLCHGLPLDVLPLRPDEETALREHVASTKEPISPSLVQRLLALLDLERTERRDADLEHMEYHG